MNIFSKFLSRIKVCLDHDYLMKCFLRSEGGLGGPPRIQSKPTTQELTAGSTSPLATVLNKNLSILFIFFTYLFTFMNLTPSIKKFASERPRAYHGVCFYEGSIYIVGGFDGQNYFNSMRRLDLVALECHEEPPMNNRRLTPKHQILQILLKSDIWRTYANIIINF